MPYIVVSASGDPTSCNAGIYRCGRFTFFTSTEVYTLPQAYRSKQTLSQSLAAGLVQVAAFDATVKILAMKVISVDDVTSQEELLVGSPCTCRMKQTTGLGAFCRKETLSTTHGDRKLSGVTCNKGLL